MLVGGTVPHGSGASRWYSGAVPHLAISAVRFRGGGRRKSVVRFRGAAAPTEHFLVYNDDCYMADATCHITMLLCPMHSTKLPANLGHRWLAACPSSTISLSASPFPCISPTPNAQALVVAVTAHAKTEGFSTVQQLRSSHNSDIQQRRQRHHACLTPLTSDAKEADEEQPPRPSPPA